MKHKEDIASKIIDEIKKFTKSPANTMKKWNNEPAWEDPVVGFSNGADPLFQFYKEDIGDFYLSPIEFLTNKYPHKEFKNENITVISWILPQTESTKRDHRLETFFPSERWARSRIFGEDFNNELRKHIMDFLENIDIDAVAPILSPLY